jgi:hypothetical protein
VSEYYLIRVDNVIPTQCQAQAYGPYRAAINLYTNAFDADSGIEYVEYWDGDPTEPTSILLGRSYNPSNSYNFIWATDPNGADDGTHHIYARAYDRAGNHMDSTQIVFKVDNSGSVDTTDLLLSILLGVAIFGITAYGLNNTYFKKKRQPSPIPKPKQAPSEKKISNIS